MRTIRSIVIWSGLQIPAIFFCGLYKLPEVWIAVGRSLSFPLDALAKQRWNVILQYILPIFICRSDSFTFCGTGTFHIFAQFNGIWFQILFSFGFPFYVASLYFGSLCWIFHLQFILLSSYYGPLYSEPRLINEIINLRAVHNIIRIWKENTCEMESFGCGSFLPLSRFRFAWMVRDFVATRNELLKAIRIGIIFSVGC